MNTINENGCSVCQPGKENYTTYNTRLRGKRVRMYQYDYRTESGELFSCCAPTLEACREKTGINGLVYDNKSIVINND